MNILLVGISHKKTPLKVRERFSFTKKRLGETLAELKKMDSVLGAVILSTCNRMEVYIHLANMNSGMEKVKKFLFGCCRIKESDLNRHFYILKSEDAVEHIFKVASGLDSQVLGETQVLGQVKAARVIARDIEVISNSLDAVFERAMQAGKIVRTETKISKGNVSLGSAAIRMIEEKFSDLQDKLVLIIGAGKIGTLVSRYLKEKRIKGIFVSNRTYTKACELAEDCGGEAVNFSHLREKLKKVDVVITSTSSPHLILGREIVMEVMKTRERPLLIMDLALPRDVAPEVREIQGVFLYDLDDLKSIVDENYNKRIEEARIADIIIRRELDKFLCRQLELAQEAAL
jgi:glutamyl-tRNA reductase